jgi:hypothetical protein
LHADGGGAFRFFWFAALGDTIVGRDISKRQWEKSDSILAQKIRRLVESHLFQPSKYLDNVVKLTLDRA